MNVTITATPEGNLAFLAPWNQAAVAELKQAIPSTERQWDSAAKRWVVTPAYGGTLLNIAQHFYGCNPVLPKAAMNTAAAQTTIFNMRYLGRVKDRGGEQSAYGWVDGGWKLVFPAAILKAWFGVENKPGEALTLYNVLAITPQAPGSEIKSAWRRLIRQWHPDRNGEPDAADQFRAIQTAYEILSDPARRARYDAGLRLERSLRSGDVLRINTAAADAMAAQEYSAPLRCGYVMCEATHRLGRFVVSQIIEWRDITRDDGCILVSSWPQGADMFQERWVKA